MKAKWLWDRLANNWDKPGVVLGENDKKIVERTAKYLNPGSVVLDYGCATGSIVFEIADKVKTAHGLDLSPKMIEIAKRKAGERKMENVSFIQGSIYDENLKEGTYDIIMALNILHLLENLPLVLNKINRLLKPGGIFISASPCLGEKKIASLLLTVPVFLFSKTGILPPVRFFSAAKLKDLKTRSGFRVIDAADLSGKSITEVYIAAKKE
jgi:ubiquinone/menaquinone biosynthesis C-methylase UbiE